MNRMLWLVGVFCITATIVRAGDSKLPKPFVTGLKNPESVAVGNDGRIYVSEIGEFGKDGDGRILVVDKAGKVSEFAKGLDDPKGIAFWTNLLYVNDNKRVVRVDPKGVVTVVADEKAFPTPPLFLNDICVDEHGVVYVSDSGDLKGNGGAIYRIVVFPLNPKAKDDAAKKGKTIVTTVTNGERNPLIKTPNGLVMDGKNHLLMLDFSSGNLLRIRVADGKTTKIADGFDGGDGLAWDHFGRLFITSWKTGKVWGIPRPGQKPILIAEGFKSAADLCLDPSGRFVIIPDMKEGTLTKLPTTIPGWAVDDSPLPYKTEVAFPKLQWTGWQGITEKGKQFPLRPLMLTHAGDGSNRVFVGIQQGTIHVFPNDPKADKTKVFLNIEKQVFYSDNENEQGMLGLAFHPKYKTNGEFFIFYTLKKDKTTNVISRFKVSKDDPNKADPDSEEVIFKVKRPFWNHDGGTICFGPDGYLYIALGDGGAADDPLKAGQKLNSLLAKVLRIDVDGKADKMAYAIPNDNPFVGVKDARPEVWAYGLRNVWRMSFDRKTGKLWASDVGQNLYEEIDIIEKGGNYGWSVREGLHPFSTNGVDVNDKMIDPIWEYHHDVGKSLTGGHVYRGKRLPELDGYYLYGDYVTTKIWGLKYDQAKKRVVANRAIQDPNVPILSFGEDEQGEVYLLTTTISGQGIRQFARSAIKK
ncbi:MAG: PQQ-dependent sugar dehydrogenase [Planctomycetes bacterium]|nr:PQQ-dependent sugar dehydrogenase [Planctomycetota bacterium]